MSSRYITKNTAAIAPTIMIRYIRPDESPSSWASACGAGSVCALNIGRHPPVLRGRDHLDGVRADHVDHDHLGAAGQQVLERDGLVLGGAVLHVDLDLARAALVAGDRDVDGAGLA